MKRCVLSPLALAVVLASGIVAEAGSITTYSDRATFEAALGSPLTTEDFTDSAHFPISTGVLNSQTDLPAIGLAPGDIQTGVTYSTAIGTGNFFNIDGGGGYDDGFLDGHVQNGYDNALTITFDSVTTGFGFDTDDLMGSEFEITINFASGPSHSDTLAVTPGSFQFFGFQSGATDITSAVILGKGPSHTFALDNFTFGNPVPVAVPEPSSLVLAGLGTIAFSVATLRRRARQWTTRG